MIQKTIDYLYRHPLSKWKTIQRFGGYSSYQKMLTGQKEMILASQKIPQLYSFANGLPIYFLTGKKYLYQTLYCIASLTKVTQEKFKFVLVDDGSFDHDLMERISKQVNGVCIISAEQINKNLAEKLPQDQYPYLHHKRAVYPHIKKLTDVHTIQDDPYKLVLDLDMLFWNEPIELINWLKNPKGAMYMLDCEESYGYSRALMEALAMASIPELMNVGAIGMKSAKINWDNLETWSSTLEQKEGASYFLEQALSAMLLVNEDQTVLNRKEYIVNPIGNQHGPMVKLHHYVDLSKKYYFETAWKAI